MKCSGLRYEDSSEIKLSQMVKMPNGQIGEIVFECGSFGIGFVETIDYDSIQEEMDKRGHCCGNRYQGIFNDNFISLFELYWNFNCDENCLDVLELVSKEENGNGKCESCN